MRRAIFRVAWNQPLDGVRSATVEIDRRSGIVAVRPLRRRRRYEMLLGDVAAMVVWHVARLEVEEERRTKRRRRGS